MILPSVLETLWFILPAWVANSAAIDVSGLPVLKRFGTPVDFGMAYRGRRLLGDGKTWRGLVCGTLAGGACAHLQAIWAPAGLYHMTAYTGLLLGFGALMGDMVESFIKRRMGMDRGHPLFLMDQLDYVFGAFFMAWTHVSFAVVGLGYLAMACLLTVPTHFLASVVAWRLKLKKNPW